MAREHNFLLGQGERITEKVKVRKQSGDKNPPYDFPTARTRIATRLSATQQRLSALPADACPKNEAVAIVTMHPRYLSKSDFPADLFSAVGLRTVGSRSRSIQPDKWGVEKHGESAVTEDIFVAGKRNAFEKWATGIPRWTEATPGAEELGHIEDISSFEPRAKLKTIPDADEALLEVVLHNAGSNEIVDAFIRYASHHGAELLTTRRRDVQGLTFIPVRIDPKRAEELAHFAFVRVARGMPSLRPFRPSFLRTAGRFAVQLPTEGPIDVSTRAVIFDGGIPATARGALSNWVRLIEPTGIKQPVPAFEAHGLGVTAAFLFGSLNAGVKAPQPICAIDHVRVLDERSGTDGNPEYFDVLNRIIEHLNANIDKYSFVNISLGPSLAMDDDEVTLWTAALDKRFAHGRCVATVAVGNDGELDAASGLNRIQPPADGVNVLAVGAADRTTLDWQRASYSCIGPGRRPGIVKPDGVAFGGSALEQFGVLMAPFVGGFETGTSLAAPMALRSAVAVRAQLGNRLGPLAIRALLIHRAELGNGRLWQEVGWGRFESDPIRLITCDDDEALVVFQGELPLSQHLRAWVPMPGSPLTGNVVLSATLVIAPDVDPEHPGAYTRSGLEVAFRPHSQRFTRRKDGTLSQHPKTRSFFSGSVPYSGAEYLLREDGHKWEPCLRNSSRLKASAMDRPCFDIYYHHRESGTKAQDPKPIPYAFIVSLKAEDVPDLYDRVVRAYANVLVPIQPQIRIQVHA